MKELILSKSPINTPVLDAELRTSLGEVYLGLSTRLGEVIVFMRDNALGEAIQQAQATVMAHNPEALSAEQQAELARQQALSSARNQHPAQLNLDSFNASELDIQTLASYLAWLELEIRDLRGL